MHPMEEASNLDRSQAARPGPVLEAVGVGKTFSSGIRALDGVHLALGEGETVALVGESGSGKSTLLKLFNRLLEPSEGEIRVQGRPAHDLDPITLRRSMGYLQQEGGLLPHWTVDRNVTLVPALLGWTAERRRARADELLVLVGLDPEAFRLRYPRQLSGGQRQRVAFARALAADPRVILLDEPFGALDALTRLELQEEFERLKQKLRKSMLLVTHDLAEAFRLADRIGVMKQGMLRQLATPHQLRRQPADDYVRALIDAVVRARLPEDTA
jgi:osmoprotectant transport system ATP-binding protein